MPAARNLRKRQQRVVQYPTTKPAAKPLEEPVDDLKQTLSSLAGEEEDSIHQPTVNMYNSEFLAKEAPLELSKLGDLSNPILPIFRPENFGMLDKSEDYKVIEPSARLASLLLTHSTLQSMLRTMLTHKALKALKEFDEKKRVYEYPLLSSPVTRDDIDINNAALTELADFVTFKTHTNISHGAAFTKCLTGTRPPIIIKRHHLHGISSEISISKKVLDLLIKATNTLASTKDTPLLLGRPFALAVDLAHEVCHALGYAKHGHLRVYGTEPFDAQRPGRRKRFHNGANALRRAFRSLMARRSARNRRY